MKRALPFVIIMAAALLTVGIAAAVYRAKTRPAPASLAGAEGTPAPAAGAPEAPEDPLLHARGPRNAPVQMEVYGDFQCPSCAFVTQEIDELQKQYHGNMRVIFHQFPLQMHPHAMEAALAAEAAALQGKFWEMHDKLYQYQPVWSKVSKANSFFESYAEMIGLDVARFRADSQSADVRMRVFQDATAGDKRGVKNTPTIFINGTELRTGFSPDKLQSAIETALAAKKSS